jgi:hypothetical protein
VQDLPSLLLVQLEEGPFGRAYIEQLDERLLAKFPR